MTGERKLVRRSVLSAWEPPERVNALAVLGGIVSSQRENDCVGQEQQWLRGKSYGLERRQEKAKCQSDPGTEPCRLLATNERTEVYRKPHDPNPLQNAVQEQVRQDSNAAKQIWLQQRSEI